MENKIITKMRMRREEIENKSTFSITIKGKTLTLKNSEGEYLNLKR